MKKYCIIITLLATVILLWPFLLQDDRTADAASEISGFGGDTAATEKVTFNENTVTGEPGLRYDPTYAEVIRFLADDPVDSYKFELNRYECRHFATDLNNNAEAAGLRCGFALLCYEKGQHALNAFETIDQGIIYVEPQTDAIVYPKVGGRYQDKEIMEILIAW